MATCRFRVLVIEDNEADIYLIKEVFRSCEPECRITLVRTQEEARALLPRKPFDLLITNAGHDMNAVTEFMRWLRSDPPYCAVPVVLFSATFDVHRAYAAGINAFLRKGLSIDEFEQKLKSMVYFWMNIAETPGTLSVRITADGS